jgi:hypothetical protein
VSGRIATALTGQRVELNSTGLKAYNAAGVNTVAINTDGSAMVTGTYQTAVSGRRLEISLAALTGIPSADGLHSLKWTPATLSADWSPAGISALADTSGAYSGAGIAMQSSMKSTGGGGGSYVVLGMDDISIGVSDPTEGQTASFYMTTADGTPHKSTAYLAAGDTTIGSGGPGGLTNIVGGLGVILSTPTGSVQITDHVGQYAFYVAEDSTSTFARSQTIYNRLYGSGATVIMTTLGTLGRLTSLERNKVNIDREWEAKADLCAIKGLAATTFYDRGNAERYAEWSALPEAVRGTDYDAEFPRRILGLIAEDVQGLGLDELLEHDDDGNLTGVAYHRLAVALLPWLHDLERRLAAQESSLRPVG